MPETRPGQPQTNKRKCGIQPAHQSLFTDVFRSRPLLCTIHPVPQLGAPSDGVHRFRLMTPSSVVPTPTSRRYVWRGIIAYVVLEFFCGDPTPAACQEEL